MRSAYPTNDTSAIANLLTTRSSIKRISLRADVRTLVVCFSMPPNKLEASALSKRVILSLLSFVFCFIEFHQFLVRLREYNVVDKIYRYCKDHTHESKQLRTNEYDNDAQERIHLNFL